MEKAQVGDLIKITNAEGAYGYEDGDIVEVVERWEDGDGVCIKSFRLSENDNYRPNVYDSEYEIYLTAAERKAKAAPGDLIRVTKDFWSDETHIGEIYEVKRVSKNGFIFVNGVWNDGSQMNFSRDEYEIYRKSDENTTK